MATRKHFNSNNAETPATAAVDATHDEVTEMKTETPVTETTVETPVETTLVETAEEPEEPVESALTSVQWSSIKPELDDLDADGLKEVIEYCSNRIEELQKEEVEELEAQMRSIQDKLLAMKGFRGKQVVKTEKTEEAKRTRTEKVVINPENPSQVYRFGKIPEWLDQLCVKTGKQVWELRVDRTASA